MAYGTHAPIKDIKTGDQVLATARRLKKAHVG